MRIFDSTTFGVLERRMKKNRSHRTEETRAEYDFRGAQRGKYTRRFAEGTNLVAIDPDVLECLPDSKAINEALRAMLRLVGKLSKASPSSRAKK